MTREEASPDATRWTLAKCEHDGHPLLIRFRQFDASFHREVFPDRLNIFWTMSQPDKNGLASDAESVLLQSFEDNLVALTGVAPIAVLAVVLTCNGKREFVFHARDASRFLESVNAIPQGAEPFPIKIQRHHDPGWKYFDAVVSDIRPSV